MQLLIWAADTGTKKRKEANVEVQEAALTYSDPESADQYVNSISLALAGVVWN